MFRLLLPEEVWALPPEQLTTELLVMYEESGFDWQKFCEWLELDLEDNEVFEFVSTVHAGWAETARVLGWKKFDELLNPRRSVPHTSIF